MKSETESEKYLPVRLSHLLRHCSVGAIVRGTGNPAYTMVVQDIRDWTDRLGKPGGEIIHYVEGVKSALGITQDLRTPPVSQLDKNGRPDGVCIPARIFPSWMRCPKCSLLYNKPWLTLEDDELPRCGACESKPPLLQVIFVMVHEKGYLADVPWHYLAHGEGAKSPEKKNCRPHWEKPYLKLSEPDGSSNWILKCQCGASSSFSAGKRIPYGTDHQQPWLKESHETTEVEDLALILELNDVRIHKSHTLSALVIPPESRLLKGTVVDRLYRSSEWRKRLERKGTPFQRSSTLRQATSHFECRLDELSGAIEELDKGYPYYGRTMSIGEVLAQEWEGLSEPIPENKEDENLVTTHHTAAWQDLKLEHEADLNRRMSMVNRLVAVRRLKEIQILKGFWRPIGDKQDARMIPPDISGKSDWLPAIELFGEGIFFTLEENRVSQWEGLAAVEQRTEIINRRYVSANLSFEPEIILSPRFLLLHTLSHLLIRELESHAGYPAASLKERIYASRNSESPMAGILIYVAVPDVAGSLGGLADMADPKRFLRLLSNALARARWCSLDPVCSEHDGQGPALLNRAACHACALIPEPSCICGNLFLDRTFVKGEAGTQEFSLPSFFDFLPEPPETQR